MMVRNSLISTFYTAFQQKDAAGMKACYSPKVIFNDPVFINLDYDGVTAMWEMLLKNGKDLALEFEILEENEHTAKAKWVATYTFSRTKRKVVNEIMATFKLEDGKIIHHTDHFDFHKWSSQALGLSGKLLGWTSFLKHKVAENAMTSLSKYREKQV